MNKSLRKGQRVAGIATILTLMLSILKGLVGWMAGSMLLIADAVHSAVDVIAIFASWCSLKLSGKKSNERFHYGYYKAENLAALIVSGFILYASYEIFTRSYERLFIIPDMSLPYLALSVPLISAAVSWIIAIYEKKVGREINSQSLIANGQESMTDIYSSLVIFIGLVLAYFEIRYVEGIMGMLLALMILMIALKNAKIAVYTLMDASPNKRLERNIKKLIYNIEGVKRQHSLKLRLAGPFIFGETTIEVSKNLNVQKAHEIADKIEAKIKERYNKVEHFIVHVEPYKPDTRKIMIPTINNKGMNSKIVSHLKDTKYLLYANLIDNKIISWYMKENKLSKSAKHAGLSAVKQALKENIDSIALPGIGEISFYALNDSQIDIYQAERKTAKDALRKFLRNELPLINKPTHASGNAEI